MKKIFLQVSLILIMGIGLQGQEALSYSKVIQTDSVGIPTLYVAIYDWFASTYNTANDVIQLADKEAGVLIGNGSMKYKYGTYITKCNDGYIKYTIKVYVKDNRYKVELTNFTHIIKPENASYCELGLITTAEESKTKKGIQKKTNEKVWKNIKLVVWEYSNNVFALLEEKTKDLKSVNADDEW